MYHLRYANMSEMSAEGHRPVRSRPVHLKAALCQINPDDAKLFHTELPGAPASPSHGPDKSAITV